MSSPSGCAGPSDERGGLLGLALLSLVAGAAAGLVGAAFRLALDRADRLRGALISADLGGPVAGCLIVVAVCAVATALSAWLVRRYSPYASGSGIPHVESVLKGEVPPAPLRLVPVKFAGGVFAIGAGLALGREGPSVQMGASVADLVGRVFRRSDRDCRVLLAAGAGAGLATAFNAPIAGAVFVLEELVRRFDVRITIATLGASASAIGVARVVLGNTSDFSVDVPPYAGFGTLPFHLALGVLAGVLGILYNRTLLGMLAVGDRFRRWPVEARAGAVGAAVGALGWAMPNLVGGGDPITQRTLVGVESAGLLAALFAARFVLGGVSYAARTPGGLFAPMLVLGAQSGVWLGMLFRGLLPDLAPDPTVLGVVGMAAFFTAVVRAPVTGIILVTEMTSSFTQLLPLLGASFAAMLVPTLTGDAPIYDSLRESAAHTRSLEDPEERI